ncbi:MAG: glyceraldehyde 3-phosphate dehydrogenase NAD-binding domain-containing protein [Minisyncoccia bacterium]
MKKTRVAINGFGRIGRTFFRMAYEDQNIEIVAINDLGDIHNLAYLLEYDTAYGRSPYRVEVQEGALIVDGKKIICTSEREPLNLPWGREDVDVVVESTGVFTSYEKAKVHLDAGAKRVVITAPVKDEEGGLGKTVLIGVNEADLEVCSISSNASCTTNAASPLVAILDTEIGIEKAILNTVHAYTASQALVDGPSKKDMREGRAAAQNIVPSSTGAAIATTLVHTQLKDKFDGISIRVPVPVGSIIDITFIAKRDTTAEEVNTLLKKAAGSPEWQNIFATTSAPLVSSDIIGARHASIADLSFTRVVGGNLVKVLAWYDNETSYTSTLIEHVRKIGLLLNESH